ncbi:MAG: hypothetical protein ABSE49_25025, partial [Polyangiaceae bacterium]
MEPGRGGARQLFRPWPPFPLSPFRPKLRAHLFPTEEPPRSLAPFAILQRLGAGGVGEVFLARSKAGKLVAIKTIADARRDSH